MHPDIKPHSRRLQTKSFVGGQDSGTFPSEDDLDGHGTHTTLLMLTMVPHAKIYVARVSGEKGVGPHPKDVAEVNLSQAYNRVLRCVADESTRQ